MRTTRPVFNELESAYFLKLLSCLEDKESCTWLEVSGKSMSVWRICYSVSFKASIDVNPSLEAVVRKKKKEFFQSNS